MPSVPRNTHLGKTWSELYPSRRATSSRARGPRAASSPTWPKWTPKVRAWPWSLPRDPLLFPRGWDLIYSESRRVFIRSFVFWGIFIQSKGQGDSHCPTMKLRASFLVLTFLYSDLLPGCSLSHWFPSSVHPRGLDFPGLSSLSLGKAQPLQGICEQLTTWLSAEIQIPVATTS